MLANIANRIHVNKQLGLVRKANDQCIDFLSYLESLDRLTSDELKQVGVVKQHLKNTSEVFKKLN